MRRVESRFLNIKFDVPEADFDLHSGMSDMPPQRFYCVTLRNRSAITMEISNGSIGVAWKFPWPVFSDHFDGALASGLLSSPDGYKERAVRNVYGKVVARDCWGMWKNGQCWRFVRFDSGEEVGYLPTPDKQARLFDQIISSACFSPAPAP
jgi:hypothetical protein